MSKKARLIMPDELKRQVVLSNVRRGSVFLNSEGGDVGELRLQFYRVQIRVEVSNTFIY